MTGTSRAWFVDRYGGPERLVLRERPDPIPGPGEAVVKTAAIGLNFADLFVRCGRLSPDAENALRAGDGDCRFDRFPGLGRQESFCWPAGRGCPDLRRPRRERDAASRPGVCAAGRRRPGRGGCDAGRFSDGVVRPRADPAAARRPRRRDGGRRRGRHGPPAALRPARGEGPGTRGLPVEARAVPRAQGHGGRNLRRDARSPQQGVRGSGRRRDRRDRRPALSKALAPARQGRPVRALRVCSRVGRSGRRRSSAQPRS